MPDPVVNPRTAALDALVWPARLTRVGMVAERLVRAFWPFWTLLLIAASLLAFGFHETLAVEAAWFGLMVIGALLVWALVAGLRQFRWPSQDQVLSRLDQTLPGRPIAALLDHQATGAADSASVALWQVHQSRMAALAAKARAPEPDLKISNRDRYGLRYLALTCFVVALLFGSIWRVAAVAEIAGGKGAAALAVGPSWEGWIEPPAHTGKPGLYLNDIKAGALAVPKGSKVTLRLYGEVGDLTIAETVSARTGDLAAGEVAAASSPSQEFVVQQSGTLAINGDGGPEWAVAMIPDAAPVVTLAGPVTHEADGRMVQPFSARDDYGVVRGRAEIALDLAAVDRRFGLEAEPEPRETLVLDLPMPLSGSRAEFTEKLIDDLSQHPFANLPVTITLFAEDAAGQVGQSEPTQILLPGRRFFDPLAASVIEMRRDLLWSVTNAARSAQILRAVTNRPDDLAANERAYLQLRVALKRMEAAPLTPEARDELVLALWDIAVLLEEGDLADAKARLDRAQDRLSEAIRNGANEQEIAKLMQELNDAMQDYMRQLAEQQAQDPDQQTAEGQESLEITQDQMQAMLDRLQQLMQEGRTAEAQELLNQLRNMMENMRVTQGQGQGQPSPGQQSMQGLADTLQDQQGLSDDAFRDLQRQFNPGQQSQGAQPGEQGQPGQSRKGQSGDQQQQQPGQGDPEGQPSPDGTEGTGQEGTDPGQSLADRQQALRDQLAEQQRNLPADGTPEGDAAREALDRAGRAMDQAEEALRQNDIPGAIDRQADAMEALRDGMRNLGRALARNQPPQGENGQQFGDATNLGQRDPLGRDLGGTGTAGTPENMLQGEDVYRRAREILDELRRRSGEQQRPETERGYLRRLLESF